jgi:ppGpp synthetase/RelA/SpoT-type nucleotidyltranferase
MNKVHVKTIHFGRRALVEIKNGETSKAEAVLDSVQIRTLLQELNGALDHMIRPKGEDTNELDTGPRDVGVAE